ncbi:hypothetical protein ACEPPZ_04445 [Paracoccus yeei]|uniref:hypothetical protein n=1 Tax=Paracoccus yeei TaxID=147645 RepID=UPI0037D655A3
MLVARGPGGRLLPFALALLHDIAKCVGIHRRRALFARAGGLLAVAIGRARRRVFTTFATLRRRRAVLRRLRAIRGRANAWLFGTRLLLRRGLVRRPAGVRTGLFAGRARIITLALRGARGRCVVSCAAGLGIPGRLLLARLGLLARALLLLAFALLRFRRLGLALGLLHRLLAGRLALARGLALGTLGLLFRPGALLLGTLGRLGALLLGTFRGPLLLGAFGRLGALGLPFLAVLRRGLLPMLLLALLLLALLLLALLLLFLLLLLLAFLGAALQKLCLALGHGKLRRQDADDGHDCSGRLEDATHDGPFPLDA